MMKRIMAICLTAVLLLTLFVAPASAANPALDTAQVYGTDWRGEYMVANINVKDAPFNAKGDGITDDTAAIQAALDAAEPGGIVYIPAGDYVVKGNLFIPAQCTLMGDWDFPNKEGRKETVLLAYADRGTEFGLPFIGMDTAATLKNISVYYPEQTADNIQPYPYTIGFYGVSVLASGVTLYNSYNAINTHMSNGSAQHVFHVYGTPLHSGITLDINLEVSEVAYVDFDIDIWASSGRPGAPVTDAQKAAVRNYTYNSRGISCGRIDDIYLYDIDVDPEDYSVGIYFYQNAVTDSVLQGGSYGHISKIHETNVHVAGYSTFGVTLDFVDDIANQSDYDYQLATDNRTTVPNILSIKQEPYNAAGDGVTDDTQAIKNCIADVAAMGGGMVFIPAGQFKVTESITVPINVELRGVLTGPHTAFRKAVSQLNVYPDVQGRPAVVLSEASGIHGLTFYYPDNKLAELVAMPYTVQGAGNNIWVQATTFVNSYDAIDLATNRCDNFFVGNTWGTAMRYGIYVGGGSDSGVIENTLFTYGIWQETKSLHGNADLATMQNLFRKNSVAYVFEDCTNFTGWSVFSFGSRIGTWFKDANGKVADNAVFCRLGLDTPWCETSLRIDNAGKVDIYGLSTASHSGAAVYESEQHTGLVNIFGQNVWGGAGNDIRNSGRVNIYASFDGFFSGGVNVQLPVEEVRASSESFNFEYSVDNVRDQFRYTGWQPDTDDMAPSLTFTLKQSGTVRSVVVYHGSSRSGDLRSNAQNYTIQASTDGKTFTDVLQVTGNTSVVAVHNIPETTAQYFRIVFTPTSEEVPMEVADVKFLSAQVDFSGEDGAPVVPQPPVTQNQKTGLDGKLIMVIVIAVCVIALTAFIIITDMNRRKKQQK